MKFMLLCYDDEKYWQQAGDEALKVGIAEAIELTHDMARQGKFITAAPLEWSNTATSVRVRHGKPLITDGPFAETNEVLGGFYLIEADDMEEAVAFAARHPGARQGTVEVRPVMEIQGLPEV